MKFITIIIAAFVAVFTITAAAEQRQRGFANLPEFVSAVNEGDFDDAEGIEIIPVTDGKLADIRFASVREASEWAVKSATKDGWILAKAEAGFNGPWLVKWTPVGGGKNVVEEEEVEVRRAQPTTTTKTVVTKTVTTQFVPAPIQQQQVHNEIHILSGNGFLGKIANALGLRGDCYGDHGGYGHSYLQPYPQPICNDRPVGRYPPQRDFHPPRHRQPMIPPCMVCKRVHPGQRCPMQRSPNVDIRVHNNNRNLNRNGNYNGNHSIQERRHRAPAVRGGRPSSGFAPGNPGLAYFDRNGRRVR